MDTTARNKRFPQALVRLKDKWHLLSLCLWWFFNLSTRSSGSRGPAWMDLQIRWRVEQLWTDSTGFHSDSQTWCYQWHISINVGIRSITSSVPWGREGADLWPSPLTQCELTLMWTLRNQKLSTLSTVLQMLMCFLYESTPSPRHRKQLRWYEAFRGKQRRKASHLLPAVRLFISWRTGQWWCCRPRTLWLFQSPVINEER